MSEVICDWLDVTCHPEDSFLDDFVSLVHSLGCSVTFEDGRRQGFSVPTGSGVIVVERSTRFHKASLSGGVLRFLRDFGGCSRVASVLGSVDYTVTRLDAALDLDVDFPLHRKLLRRRHKGSVQLAPGKGNLRIKELLERRDDGFESGTWYAGHRQKAQITGRVYDKQLEIFERSGELVPPRTRIELTLRKGSGVSLSDFLDPAPVFWKFSPALLPAKMVRSSSWEPSSELWAFEPEVDVTTAYEVFLRRLESSPEIASLGALGAEMGENAWPVIERHVLKVFRSAYQDALGS